MGKARRRQEKVTTRWARGGSLGHHWLLRLKCWGSCFAGSWPFNQGLSLCLWCVQQVCVNPPSHGSIGSAGPGTCSSECEAPMQPYPWLWAALPGVGRGLHLASCTHTSPQSVEHMGGGRVCPGWALLPRAADHLCETTSPSWHACKRRPSLGARVQEGGRQRGGVCEGRRCSTPLHLLCQRVADASDCCP